MRLVQGCGVASTGMRCGNRDAVQLVQGRGAATEMRCGNRDAVRLVQGCDAASTEIDLYQNTVSIRRETWLELGELGWVRLG